MFLYTFDFRRRCCTSFVANIQSAGLCFVGRYGMLKTELTRTCGRTYWGHTRTRCHRRPPLLSRSLRQSQWQRQSLSVNVTEWHCDCVTYYESNWIERHFLHFRLLLPILWALIFWSIIVGQITETIFQIVIQAPKFAWVSLLGPLFKK